MTDITRADFDRLHQDIVAMRIEWRQEMIANTRWLAGLFVGQFIATVGATAGVVGWMLSHWGYFRW
jgi:hypothetical protein